MRRTSEAGFTLLELLVSLAILGLMAATLLSGLVTGRRVWERVETRTGESEEVAAAQNALRDMIETIYPRGSFDGSRPHVEFAGDARGFSFQGAPARAQGPSYPWLHRIGLSQAGALTLYAANPLSVSPGREATARPLIGEVTGVEFAYFGPTDFDPRPRWRDRWRDQSALPEAVRVRLSFRPSDRRFWPDLVAQPAATIDTFCVNDATIGRCRGR